MNLNNNLWEHIKNELHNTLVEELSEEEYDEFLSWPKYYQETFYEAMFEDFIYTSDFWTYESNVRSFYDDFIKK